MTHLPLFSHELNEIYKFINFGTTRAKTITKQELSDYI